jgi:hypothetical protein
VISGSGFAIASTTGRSAIDLTIALVTVFAFERPRNTSQSLNASSSVRSFVFTAKRALYSLRSSRSVWMTPLVSSMITFSRLAPAATIMSPHAMPAAPAPEITTRIFAISLPVSSTAFRIAAVEMIAVPCWSSWKTGIPISFLSRVSM